MVIVLKGSKGVRQGLALELLEAVENKECATDHSDTTNNLRLSHVKVPFLSVCCVVKNCDPQQAKEQKAHKAHRKGLNMLLTYL